MDDMKFNKDRFLFKSLNNLFWGISQLAERVPMGGKNYVEMACDYYTERMFNEYVKHKFNPASNRVIDLCQSWIEIMDSEGFLDKNDYQLEDMGDSLYFQVNSHNCTYYEYCEAVNNEGLPVICPRMIICKWIVTNFIGPQYQMQLEPFGLTDTCRGALYPREMVSEILSRDGDKISIAGERAIVLSTNAYGILLKTIYNYAPHLLERVLYESTYYSSLLEYDKIESYYKSKREVIEHLLNTIRRLGNIRYEIVEYDELNKRAVVKAYGSYMAEIFVDNKLFTTPKTSCASGRGRLAAYFTKAWGEDIICEEMKCEAFGDEHCEFVLLPKGLDNIPK
ncbi:MAG: 4-vinyl reductase [Syntrophomonadaceae bacterium]|nr:4-vinyl reductase [Syntrophomonadaceae bacterium]